MPLSRRYTPEMAPNEKQVFGMDYSYVIPPGVGIESGTLEIFTNVAVPAEVPLSEIAVSDVAVQGRVVYATVEILTDLAGTDLQLVWTAVDTQGNIWQRTALLLCAPTS